MSEGYCTKDVALEWALKECEKDSYPAVVLRSFYERIEKLEKENEELKAELQKLNNAEEGYALIAECGDGIVGAGNVSDIYLKSRYTKNDVCDLVRNVIGFPYKIVPCKVVIEK